MAIHTTFSAVPVGVQFEVNGNTWRKQSSRTAVMTEGPVPGRWFYFSKYEHVVALCDSKGVVP